MSLLRLLTAGKSLIGVNHSGSRYRDAGRGMLPKFATKKNPFRATAKAGTAAAGEVSVRLAHESQQSKRPFTQTLSTYEGERESTPAPGALIGEREKPVERQKPKEKESTSASGGQLRRPVRTVARSGAGWIRHCGAELKSWLLSALSVVSKSGFVRGRLSVKPAAQRVPKPLVQCELSLERIKVVRNDLSDSDLEVVQAKPLVVAGPSEILRQNSTPALPSACLAQRPEVSRWTRVSARFLGAGKL
ncbi:MAG TPA: hypothetical protein VN578_08955 [Candidatus Binatia bacterium]|jgi:hypothetical protein|nr:hypothetical protein [Candidatus Binatia bacterium]